MADGINFNLLGVGEASPFQQAQQRDVQNQLVQQQLASGRMQQELGGINLANAKRERDALAALQQKFVENGHSPDLSKNFRAMVESGIPHYVDIGMKGMQALQNQARFRELMGGGATPAGAPAAAAAPAEPQPMMGEGAQIYPIPSPAPTNALAPAAAPAAAPVATPAPVAANALAMPDEEAQLERKIAAAYEIGDARSLAWAKTQEKKLEDMRKAHPIGGRLVTGAGKVIYTTPEELAGDMRQIQQGFARIEELKKLNTPAANAEITAINAAIKAIGEGKGTKVNVITGKQEAEFEKELGKGQAKDLLESRAKAEDARDILSTVRVGKDLLKSGVITGAGAEFLVGLNQALKTAGVDMGYADAAANSQAYMANMAQNVGKLIKQFGAGTGLSDADRAYAEQMAGGKISLDRKALDKILNIQERAANNVIKRHNQKVQGIKTNIPLAVEPESEPSAPKAATSLNAVDKQALDWANANPKDPRAAKIKERLGVK